jgi:hypothetical protein
MSVEHENETKETHTIPSNGEGVMILTIAHETLTVWITNSRGHAYRYEFSIDRAEKEAIFENFQQMCGTSVSETEHGDTLIAVDDTGGGTYIEAGNIPDRVTDPIENRGWDIVYYRYDSYVQ